MTEHISFYDWCAAAWLRMHQRYGFDDASFVKDDIDIWRQAWLAGEAPGDFANGYAERRCYLDPLYAWTGARTDEPKKKVPSFPDPFAVRLQR